MLKVATRLGRWPVALTLAAVAACSDEPAAPPLSAPIRPNLAAGDVYTVTNTNDSGIGSLRWSLGFSTGGETIRFDVPVPFRMPDQQQSASVTELLAKARSGDSSALANVFPLIYDELRRGDRHAPDPRRSRARRSQNRVDEALPLLERVASAAAPRYGERGPRTGDAQLSLGLALVKKGRYTEAEAHLRSAQSILNGHRKAQPRLAARADEAVATINGVRLR